MPNWIKIRHLANRYCTWLTQTIKGENTIPPHRDYGLYSIVLAILMLSLSFKSLFTTILNFLANMFISAPSGTSLDEFGTGTVQYLASFRNDNFISGLFLVTINFMIIIGISYYLCHKISHEKISFRAYLNHFAVLTNGALVLEFVGVLLAAIGVLFKLVVVLDFLALLLYNLATIDNLWKLHYSTQQKRLYITTAALVLYQLCFLVILYVLIFASK